MPDDTRLPHEFLLRVIRGEAVDGDKALRHAAAEHVLEQLAQDGAVPEPAVAVLRKGGVVGHLTRYT